MEIRPFRPASAKPADQKHYINVSCFCNDFPAFSLCSSASPVVQKNARREQHGRRRVAREFGHPLVSPTSVGLVI
jgi:hypothetical protein